MKSVILIVLILCVTASGIYGYSVYHRDQLVKECAKSYGERDTDGASEAACLELK